MELISGKESFYIRLVTLLQSANQTLKLKPNLLLSCSKPNKNLHATKGTSLIQVLLAPVYLELEETAARSSV